MELEELKGKIIKGAGISEGELDEKIEEKVIELSGLVSEEGAAYIVAKELGLDLIEKRDLSLKIKNILPGLKAIDVVGKILSLSEMREFKKGDRSGKVRNIMIGDETGSVRVVFWNDLVRFLEKFNEGDVVKIGRGFTKANSFGMPEIHMGNTSTIEKVDIKIEAAEASRPFSSGTMAGAMKGERKPLEKAKENDFLETKALIVSTFESEYLTCPLCDGKLEEEGGEYICPKDGKVEQKKNLIVKGFIDDGTIALRFVAFREVAEKIKKEKLLGKEVTLTGRIKKNDYFGNLELLANQVNELDLESEIEKLL
jgi:DNA/RNA endonuclease YhcR with UshA esterase domain